VPNWSISRNYKENWNSTKIIVTAGNAPDMRRQCAKATDQWAQRVVGWPNSLTDRPHFSASRRLASQARSVGGSNKESEAGSWWKPNSVAGHPCG
jgi:hypothetical protein